MRGRNLAGGPEFLPLLLDGLLLDLLLLLGLLRRLLGLLLLLLLQQASSFQLRLPGLQEKQKEFEKYGKRAVLCGCSAMCVLFQLNSVQFSNRRSSCPLVETLYLLDFTHYLLPGGTNSTNSGPIPLAVSRMC